MKKCNKCKKTKELHLFIKAPKNKDGLGVCKQCRKELVVKYREKQKIYSKRYRDKNKEKIKKYRDKNKEVKSIKQKEYRKKNYKKVREAEKRNEKKRDRKEYQKEYRKKNYKKIRKWNRKYEQNKIKKDPLYAFKRKIQSNIRSYLIKKGYRKKSRTEKILGADYNTVHCHLIKTFEDRYGITLEKAIEPVHIDHIIPLSTAKTEEDLIKLNHYTNLQYLYASDNLEKGDRLDWEKL
jgi:hypothetical protein